MLKTMVVLLYGQSIEVSKFWGWDVCYGLMEIEKTDDNRAFRPG